MPSTFTRLYRYAKAVGAEAKENYTTEALRAAIATDPRPLLDALFVAGVIDAASGFTTTVDTQFAIKNVGVIDLVLTLTESTGLRRNVWLEIKVDANESGDQLGNYRRFIDAQQAAEKPTLIVLGPKPLRDGVPWVSWQQLRLAITTSETTSPYWLDFKTYLEEIGMADNYDEPVTPTEAQALHPARSLLGKLIRILTPFTTEANSIWRGGGWPDTEQKVRDALLSMFEKKGTFTVSNNLSSTHGVSAGLYHEPTTDDGWLGLWLWMKPTRVTERQAILLAVAQSQDSWRDDEWHRAVGDWELVGAYRRLVEVKNHAEGTAWLRNKLAELKSAGLLDLMVRT